MAKKKVRGIIEVLDCNIIAEIHNKNDIPKYSYLFHGKKLKFRKQND